MSYNEYQQMHHTALYGKGKPRKPNTLYKLLYNSQVIIPHAPYGVCRSKQNDLQRQVNYQSGIFKIVPCH